MFTALLDTSVLWPSLQRDFLLSLAIESLYRPAWSSAILAELEYSETAKLHARGAPESEAATRAASLVRQMRRAFPDAETSGWEPLEGTFALRDPDDEHVVAAAVLAQAGVIVTSNLKDFPAHRLPDDLDVLAPAEFCYSTVEIDPVAARRAVKAIAARSGRTGTRWDTAAVLDQLADRYAMHDVADLLRRAT